ncbi:hypothetical protein BHM03_00042774 [Ensete ventricosum]|nr:hypothetical protein BHM03_00042774 [Ensete ventricosum]
MFVVDNWNLPNLMLAFHRAGPVYFGFPEFKGHSRRDYWLAVVREVLQVHKFIRKYYDLDEIQQMESLSKAMLGIFRYRALKEAFHIHPPRFRSILGFYLAEKLPKGDKILEAFYDYLKLPPDLHGGGCPLPFSLYTVAKMGFAPNMEAVVDGVEEKCILVGDVCVGSTSSSLETAVKESFCCSEIAEAARATVDQMKVDGIDTNLAVMKATDETALTLIVAATLVAVVPFGHLMVLTALEGFTREMPLRRKTSEKLRRRLREWWARIPAAPVELVRHKSFSSRDSVQYVIGG